jgi:hypothetical protein
MSRQRERRGVRAKSSSSAAALLRGRTAITLASFVSSTGNRGSCKAPSTSRGWGDPLAVTSAELFATVNVAGGRRVARVRLDSLGPGIPPD